MIFSAATGAACQTVDVDRASRSLPGARRDATASGLEPSTVKGSVLLRSGSRLGFTSTEGLLSVGSTDQQDARLDLDGNFRPDTQTTKPANPDVRPATARMSYTAYFAQGRRAADRPVVFIYDGGPGSSSRSLVMASFGPVWVAVPDPQTQTQGPARITDNPDTLLDAADLVFIDAPGTGFGSIQGQGAAGKFFGIDGDAAAFARFIQRFLTKYDRWESPRYLFGHSYGTVRNAALAWQLAQDDVSLNGIISVSQWLNIDDFLDSGKANPATDNPYFLALPSYAAIAWYHHRLAHRPAHLSPWLDEVEHYAVHEYADALLAGTDLSPEAERLVAARLESYTGIAAATWIRADLRLPGDAFEQLMLGKAGRPVGRLDSRYTGWSVDPLAARAEYDPFSSATSPAIAAAMNSYARDTLKFGRDLTYQPFADVPDLKWDTFHVTTGKPWQGFFNVIPDLANTIIRNPAMHVLVMGGYFDLSTSFFAAIYEVKHLPLPRSLDRNVELEFFPTGHEPYLDADVRRSMHDRIARFIAETTG